MAPLKPGYKADPLAQMATDGLLILISSTCCILLWEKVVSRFLSCISVQGLTGPVLETQRRCCTIRHSMCLSMITHLCVQH